jgi:excisionase family DNA binding protein
MSQAQPELITVAEAAVLLRTSTKGVYTLVERGAQPGVTRVGRRVLIRAADLRKYLGLA